LILRILRQYEVHNELKELYTDKIPYCVHSHLMHFSNGEVPVISEKQAAMFLGRVTGKLCITKVIALLPYVNGFYRGNIK
jgi:hypothetical protein